MTESIIEEFLLTRKTRENCALVTVASIKGSVPREPGSKMIVYSDRKISGTIGGGKFESLVIEESINAINSTGEPILKRYPLRENEPDSFGAICGGEVTVLIEPQKLAPRLILVGAGHCSQAIASLAHGCGFHVTVIDDRAELLSDQYYSNAENRISNLSAQEVFKKESWQPSDSGVSVSRNYMIDKEALRVLLPQHVIGYIGMIGSNRKVKRVFEELVTEGTNPADLERIYAPIGLDICADSPAEIAVSVIGEVIKVQRKASGKHMRLKKMPTQVKST